MKKKKPILMHVSSQPYIVAEDKEVEERTGLPSMEVLQRMFPDVDSKDLGKANSLTASFIQTLKDLPDGSQMIFFILAEH